MIAARWSDADGAGLEHLTLRPRVDGHAADGVIISADEPWRALRYRIAIDAAWRVREVRIEAIGGPSLVLAGDGEGRWRDGAGEVLAHLDGAIDIDLTGSPFTNTLPIRRLDLPVEASAEIRVVYIDCGDLAVTVKPQRYTRVSSRHWRFESLDVDFQRDLEVDEHGLVKDYPGLFRRVV
jgi:hypothetical protein